MTTMLRIPKHVQVALEDGMAAGFRQFASASQKSGLNEVKASWEPYKALNRKSRFNLYCSTFGPLVESLGAPKASATRANVVQERTDDALQLLIEEHEALGRRIAELQAKPAKQERTYTRSTNRSAPKAQPKAAGIERKFTAGAVDMFDLPTKVGATFEYEGKAGKFTWKVKSVKRDGSIIATR